MVTSGSSMLARDLERGVHRAPPEPPIRMPSWRVTARAMQERVAVRTPDPPVDDGGVERARPEVLADPLDQVRPRLVAGVHGALGVGADDRHVGLLLLQVAADAGDRAARADARDEDVDRRRPVCAQISGPVVS